VAHLAQRRQDAIAKCKNQFREKINGAGSDREQLARLLAELDDGDVVIVTRLDRLARSTRDLLNTLAAIGAAKATFRSLHDAWADTTTPHGRLILTVLGGLAEFERHLIVHRTSERRAVRPSAEANAAPAPRSDRAPRWRRRDVDRHRPKLQRQPLDHQSTAIDKRIDHVDFSSWPAGRARALDLAPPGRDPLAPWPAPSSSSRSPSASRLEPRAPGGSFVRRESFAK
jgi:DNA invertase Pin-like site-specific DNA recombinase